MRRPVFVSLLLALAPTMGCLVDGDRPAGRMSVQLHIDAPQDPPPDLEVSLYDVSEERTLTEPAECHIQQERLMVVCNQLDPGLYELRVQVADGERRWSQRCEGLALDRFEERYECELDLTANADGEDGVSMGSPVDAR